MSSASIGKIGDLCEQVRGVTYSKDDAVLTPRFGYKPVLRAGNITDNGLVFDNLVFVPESSISSRQYIRRNDVVIAVSSGSVDVVGKAARAMSDFDGGFGAFCKLLRPSSRVDPAYFYHYFQTKNYRQRISHLAAGANIYNLRNDHLNELEIYLPPLPEQRRIAEILDKADALLAKRRQAAAKIDQLMQSVFIEMFGDPMINPKGWKIRKSSELFSDKPRIGTTAPASGDGVLVVRVGEIGQYHVALEKSSRVVVSDSEIERHKLLPGDIVLARAIGSRDQLGKCSFFKGHTETVIVDSHVMRLRPKDSICHPAWFYFLISSNSGKKMLQSKGGETAVQFNINSSQASDLDIPVPPIGLQINFVKIIEFCRQQSDLLARASLHNSNILVSLQQRAFSGTL